MFVIDHVRINIRRRHGSARFVIPLIGARGLGHVRDYEPEMLAAFVELLSGRPGHFVDVGANIGQTLLSLRSVDRDRPYVGFEPNVVACGYCQELIWANRFVDTDVLPLALSDAPGVLPLHLRDTEYAADSSASLRVDNRRADFFDRRLLVPVSTGDAVLADLCVDRVAAIKIDTEGTEAAVLRGLSTVVARDQPVIFVEILSLGAALNEDQRGVRIASAGEIEAWAREVGYDVHQLKPGGDSVAVDDIRSHLPEASGRNYVLRQRAR